jgi:glyoxylase-like metal-dependent hydrolase (beta-lactamase superfamily II)
VPIADRPRIRLGDNVLYPLPLRDGGILQIDAGPDIPASESTEDSWSSLVTQLAAHGFEVSEVRTVLITHAHLDHAGLAGRWAAEGTSIVAGAADVAAITLGQASSDAQRALQLTDLRRHGTPIEVIERMRSPRRHIASLRWEPTPAASLATHGGTYHLKDGHTLEVIDSPGHTPGNLVAFIPETGELFSGDTILPTTVPTPGMHYPGAIDGIEDAPRWPSLPPFVASVARIREREVRRILPAHGDVVDNTSRLFDRFEEHHARRARRVRAALADGPLSAYGVAKRMFPRIPPRRLGQALTEVLGHLDRLVEAGAGEFIERDQQVQARLTQ